MEIWKTARTILGQNRGARLMILGIFLVSSSGVLRNIPIGSDPSPTVLIILGIMSFLNGLELYKKEELVPRHETREVIGETYRSLPGPPKS